MQYNSRRCPVSHPLIAALLAALAAVPPALSRHEPPDRACGFYPGAVIDTLARHRLHNREREREIKAGRRQGLERGPFSIDVGDIAVIQDDGSLISSGLNPFDLRGRSLRFTPRSGGGYDLALGLAPVDTGYSNRMSIRDDDSLEISLGGVAFPFYEKSYGSLFLNSDGNLTFGAGDRASTERSLGRFRTGPPRIAGFFNDLNPEQGGRVFADVSPTRAMFTWEDVPEFDAGNANTFQMVLFPNGDILFAFSSTMDAKVGIVGISPGGVTAELTLVNYNVDLPTSIPSGAVAESFSNRSSGEIDLPALAQAFYRDHPDDFDNLVVFSTPTVDLGNAFAFYRVIKNDTRGIGDQFLDGPGDDFFDFAFAFGSRGRLQGILNMNQLSVYPDDPTVNISGVGGENNTLDIMGQESGHRWGLFLMLHENGVPTYNLLGRDMAHWSFFTDSDASEMEGNDIRDNGNGTFTTVDVTQRFNHVDQYLMGLRPASDVQPFFYVKDTFGTAVRPSANPRRGVTFSGTRREVTIQDIIATNGLRVPEPAHAPKVLRQAFILLIGKGETARPVDLQKVERIRSQWVQFFRTATDNLGSVNTSLASTARAATHYIPFMEGDGQRYTGVAAANRDTLPATLTFTAYSGSGALLSLPGITNPAVVRMAGGEQRALLDAQLLGLAVAQDRSGWLQVSSTSDRVAVFYLSGDLNQNFLDGAVAADSTASRLIFTRVYEGAALFGQETVTQFSLVNPGNDAASVTLRYFNAAGSEAASASRSINSRGRLAESFRQLFPQLPLPVTSGYVEVTSSTGLAGVQLVRFGETLFALPGQAPSTATRLYSAQFASGGLGLFPAPFFTNLKLVNTGDAQASVSLRIVAEDGSLLQAPGVTNPLVRTLAPRGELAGNAAALFGFPDDRSDTSARVGSVIVEISSGAVVGDVTFGDALNGAIMAGLVLESRLFNGMIFSQVAEGTSAGVRFFSGLAALNPGNLPVELTITVYNERGQITGLEFMELRAGQRISKTLGELVSGVSGQMRGYIQVDVLGATGVAIFELFGDTELRRFLAAVPPQAYAVAP